MFDDKQKSEIKALVAEAIIEIAEREPRTIRENHDYVARMRQSDANRLERKKQMFDKVAGAVVIAVLFGLVSLIVGGGLQWLRGNL